MASKSTPSRIMAAACEAMPGLLLLGLLIVVTLPSRSHAGGGEPTRTGMSLDGILPAQGTPIAATINGSIDGTEPTFSAPGLLASGTPGDKNCRFSGKSGARFYDEVKFFNTSSTNQTVSIGFAPSCGTDIYMAAYYQQFDPAKICANFIASPGNLGDSILEFTVCPNAQFSVVVFGADPGSTCGGYTYTVFGDTIEPVGSRAGEVGKIVSTEGLLPLEGTPLVAFVSDGIDEREPIFTGRPHAFSPIPGERNCRSAGGGTFYYDEYFFINNSSTTQMISVRSSFNSCSGGIFMGAYSPRFDPSDVCRNFLGSANNTFNWDFVVCANSTFSIVAYGPVRCSNFSFQVFGNNISFLGQVADLTISKTGPAGPAPVGSNITYNIRVTNNGPNPARTITISDPLPAGTTFVSLANNSGIPPFCTTPAPGNNGTVTCRINRLLQPVSAINFSSFSIVVNVSPSAPAQLANTAAATFIGIDSNTSDNTSTSLVSLLNICLQDQANGNILTFSPSTGDYQFINCRKSITLAGRGRVTLLGCKVTLQDGGPDPKRPDRNLQVNVNTCTGEGFASLQIFSQGTTSTIADSDMTDNTCACQ